MKRKAEPDAEDMASSKGPSTSKKLAPDTNNDFINETELQKSIQVSVLKTADDVVEEFARQGGERISFDPEVLSHVVALVWDTVSDDWTTDLLAFAGHAGRETVNVADAALIMRKNNQLLEMVSKAADIDLGEYERPVAKRHRTGNKELTRGKRGARAGTSRPGTSAAHNNPTRPSSKTSTGPNSPACVTADRGDNGAKRRRDEEDVGSDVMIVDTETEENAQVAEEDPALKKDVKKTGDDLFFDELAVGQEATTILAKAPDPAAAEEVMEEDFSLLDGMVCGAPVVLKPLQASTPLPKTPFSKAREVTPTGHRNVYVSIPPSRSEKKVDRKQLESVPEDRAGDKSPSQGICLDDNCDGREGQVARPHSPDLFNTPVKGNDDSFDDFGIPDLPTSSTGEQKAVGAPKQVPKGAQMDEASEKKWSAKFSEFSFFDSVVVDAPGPQRTDGVCRETERSAGVQGESKQQDASFTTPKQHSSSAASKSKSGRCLATKPAAGACSADGTPKTGRQTRAMVSSAKSTPSRLPSSTVKRFMPKTVTPMATATDSDDEFFDL